MKRGHQRDRERIKGESIKRERESMKDKEKTAGTKKKAGK